jgi:hypothetical protein
MLPPKQNFQGAERFILFKVVLLSYLEETEVSLKKSLCSKQEHPGHGFLVRTDIVFERIILPIRNFKMEKHLYYSK